MSKKQKSTHFVIQKLVFQMATINTFRYTTSPIVIILGATAVGKTKLSVHLSKCFNGEIVNADTM